MRRLGVLALCAAMFGPAAAWAQEADAASTLRPGKFSFNLWSGYMYAKADCENCEEATYRSTMASGLLPQWRVNDKMQVGVELVFNPLSRENVVRTSHLLASVQFHPWRTHGFFLKAGYGLTWVKTKVEIEGDDTEGKFRGMAVNYGAGWHFRRERRLSAAVFGAHYVSTLGNVKVGAREAVNVTANGWIAALSIVIQ